MCGSETGTKVLLLGGHTDKPGAREVFIDPSSASDDPNARLSVPDLTLARHDDSMLADPKITALVYVAARAPDAGEDYAALAKNYPTPPASAGVVFNDDWGQLTEEAFLHDFAGDLPKEEARVLYAVQQPFKKSLNTDKTTNAAWRTKPTFYAVSTEDRTINPDLERFMAKRMGAKTIEVKSSHLSLISHPDAITDLILQALAV
jgi:pimeloyl-ACP methyl ester carboxylesterase